MLQLHLSVIDDFIAYWGATYIRDFTVLVPEWKNFVSAPKGHFYIYVSVFLAHMWLHDGGDQRCAYFE